MGVINMARSVMPQNLRVFLSRYYPTILNLVPRRWRYHQDYFEVFRLNRLAENGQQSLVNAIMAQRLASVLKDALTHVPHYRESVRIQIEDIIETTAFEVLQAFPYLYKEEIMQNRDRFLNERYQKRDLLYITTGGSTGQGIGVWSDRRERQVEKAFFDYEWGKFGYIPHRSKVVRFGMEACKRENEIPWSQIGNRLLISPYHLNKRWLPQIYSQISDFKPDFFHSYPSCLEMVARYIKYQGLPKIWASGIFLASEAFTESQYELFKQIFDAPIKAHYGLCERTNLAFMYENDDKESFFYRVNSIYGFSENLPDEYGNQEIVGTSYWNHVMPFIRYRTQDFGMIEPDGMIRQLDGRNQELLITRTGAKIPGFSIKIDEFTWDYVSVYQVVQEQKGAIVLRIVPRSNFNEHVKTRLLEKQTERWGEFFKISIELVDSIPRTASGKHRLIVNNLPDRS